MDGEIVQHIEYVPFGEVFIEERNNKWDTPFLFNAKELDEETGLYYYGARYYDPRVSIFYGVDPLVEKTGTPYQYCYQNPVKFIDPTGMASEVPTDYVDQYGKTLESTNDRNSSRTVIVPEERLKEFKEHLLYSDTKMKSSSGWNDYWAGEFEGTQLIDLTTDQWAVLDMQHSGWAKRNAVKYWESGSLGDYFMYALSEALSQYTDPQLVVGGLSTGVAGLSSMPLKGGVLRSATYSKGWSSGSLTGAIKRFAPGARGNASGTGKIIYRNNKTGVQIVHDPKGNYFRIEDTTLSGKARYLDLDGNRPVNKVENGKTRGRNHSEYNQVTHFNNND